MTEDALHRFLIPGTDPAIVEIYSSLAEEAADAAFGFEEEIVLVDIETTGFDADEDEIIEIAALLMRGPEILDRFQTFVATQRPIPLETTRLTGITDADLKGSPGVEAAVADLAEFVGGRDVVAHDAVPRVEQRRHLRVPRPRVPQPRMQEEHRRPPEGCDFLHRQLRLR